MYRIYAPILRISIRTAGSLDLRRPACYASRPIRRSGGGADGTPGLPGRLDGGGPGTGTRPLAAAFAHGRAADARRFAVAPGAAPLPPAERTDGGALRRLREGRARPRARPRGHRAGRRVERVASVRGARRCTCSSRTRTRSRSSRSRPGSAPTPSTPRAAGSFLALPPSDPPFERCDSSLLAAVPTLPGIAKPDGRRRRGLARLRAADVPQPERARRPQEDRDVRGGRRARDLRAPRPAHRLLRPGPGGRRACRA